MHGHLNVKLKVSLSFEARFAEQSRLSCPRALRLYRTERLPSTGTCRKSCRALGHYKMKRSENSESTLSSNLALDKQFL